jgi:hypothetical protein
MFAIWPREAFEGEGQLSTFDGRSFLPALWLAYGPLTESESFDNPPSDLAPQYELWTPRREAWLHSLPWAVQFEADRPSDART